MGLKTMSLLSGATLSASAGTALGFTDNGVTVSNGIQLTAPTDSDYQTRRTITAKYKPATVTPKTSAYGKDKKSITIVKPSVLASGEVVFNLIRIEREVHPSLAAADCLELNKLGAQVLFDTDLDNFWQIGSLS